MTPGRAGFWNAQFSSPSFFSIKATFFTKAVDDTSKNPPKAMEKFNEQNLLQVCFPESIWQKKGFEFEGKQQKLVSTTAHVLDLSTVTQQPLSSACNRRVKKIYKMWMQAGN